MYIDALFVGGPWHGQVRPVNEESMSWLVPVPDTVDYVSETSDQTFLEIATYCRRLYRIAPGQPARVAFVLWSRGGWEESGTSNLLDARKGGDGATC